MFCDRCGRELGSTARFCSACGKPVGHHPALDGPQAGRVHKHLKTVAVLWIVDGALRLLHATWILTVGRVVASRILTSITGSIVGFPAWLSLDAIVNSSLVLAGIWNALFAVIAFLAAWGLTERQPWARILVLVIACLSLFRFPLGTALGIYTIWVLLPTPSGQEYDALVRVS